MCQGKARLESGKFHNHCTECPDFGVCIGDYRVCHCGICGHHYFTGGSGFPCNKCGGKPLPKPLASVPVDNGVFNGVIPLTQSLQGAVHADADGDEGMAMDELEMLLAQNPGLAEQLRPLIMMMALAQGAGANPHEIAAMMQLMGGGAGGGPGM